MNPIQPTKQSDPEFGSDDYYQVLGISQDANPAEIKAAYKRLALARHPDRNNGDDQDFLRIKEAYDILMDPGLREKYDTYGRISPEDELAARKLVATVVESIFNNEMTDLAHTDLVESVRQAMLQGKRDADQAIANDTRKRDRLARNKKRTQDKVILASFNKHIGVLDQQIASYQKQRRHMDIVLHMLKNSSWEVDPMPQQQFTGTGSIAGFSQQFSAPGQWRGV